MPQMKKIDIDFISLVNKGANKQTVKIYKADKKPVDSEDEEFRGFFNVMKSFFTKDKKEKIAKEAPTKPTDFNQVIGLVETEERIRQARWTLMDVLENILDSAAITDKASAMSTEIDKFKTYVVGTVNAVGIAKALEEVRSIKKYESEDEDMKAEEIKKMLDDALAPIKDELKVLKGEEEALEDEKGEETQPEQTQEEVIAKAIKEVTETLMNEITELKKSRRAPQSLDTGAEGKEVKKSYIGAFEGMFK